jgi:hypothetical protein
VHLVDGVASTAATNVINWSSVLPQPLLLGQLFIEREHGSLLLAVNVSGASTA